MIHPDRPEHPGQNHVLADAGEPSSSQPCGRGLIGWRAAVEDAAQLGIFVVDESAAIQWLNGTRAANPRASSETARSCPGFPRCWSGTSCATTARAKSRTRSMATSPPAPRSCPTPSRTIRPRVPRRRTAGTSPPPRQGGRRGAPPHPCPDGEFEEYRKSPQERLKLFRLEAVCAGFFNACQEQDHTPIKQLPEKLPKTVLQEDPKLLPWYDQAPTRMEQGS